MIKHGDAETKTEPVNSSRGTGEPALAASKTDEDQEVVPQAGEVLVAVASRAVAPGDEQQDQSEVIPHDVQVSEAVPVVPVAAAPEPSKDGGLTSAPSKHRVLEGKGGNRYKVSGLAVLSQLPCVVFITG